MTIKEMEPGRSCNPPSPALFFGVSFLFPSGDCPPARVYLRSMKALVPQFQEELALGEKKTSDLLRMAQLISAKLKLDEILQWIGHELNGYPADFGAVPKYRDFKGGILQVYNPYRGWEDVINHRTVSMETRESVPELEVFAKEKFIVMHPRVLIPVGPSECSRFRQQVVFPRSRVVGVLEAVKNKLMDWSIELEQRGIIGDNMSFNEQEQRTAKSQTFNIQNMHGVIGDSQNSQINIYDYSFIYQALKDHDVPQKERNEIETILDELKAAKPGQKHSWIEKGKQWISRNKDLLGDFASVLLKAFSENMR